MATTLTSKSQVTLPKAIRDYLKVAPGDQVEFRIVADGGVRVEPVHAAIDHEALIKARRRVAAVRGSAKTGRSTEQWMNLLRGYDDDARDPGFAAPVQRPAGKKRRAR